MDNFVALYYLEKKEQEKEEGKERKKKKKKKELSQKLDLRLMGQDCERIYRDEDMQDGVDVPALRRCIPDRDTEREI